MKNLVALLFMISVPVVSAFLIKCNFCKSDKPSCFVTEVDCCTKRCMTLTKLIRTDEGAKITFMKGCANETLCQMKNPLPWMSQEHARCCSGELCNTDRFGYVIGYLPILNLHGVKPTFFKADIDIEHIKWYKDHGFEVIGD
ncbi:uncharacterized protein ACNLHF_002142 [Anomaloglossus baeobatrachus]